MVNYAKKIILFTVISTTLGCINNDPAVLIPPKEVTLATSSIGKILTDVKGKTLYFFSNDIAGGTQCTGNCLTNWPIYYKPDITVGDGLSATDFATITRSDGAMQTTYKGWPLYYYASDAAAGEVKGENVGKIWFAAKPDYSIFVANAQLVGNNGKFYLSDYTEGNGKTRYLVDNKGRTLYAFKPDKKNTNTFTKSDFSNDSVWPIAQINDLSNLPSGFTAAEFTIIDVFGKKQLCYKGHPLYYFGLDNNVKGSTKGVSVPQPGIWPIVNSETTPLE